MLTNFQTKYKVQCKIGEGSFSEVLKCQNKESGQLFAAKRLKKSFPNASNAAEISEIIAMKRLPHHPHILQLIESHFEPTLGRVTLIFDLMDMSIYDMMKNRKRPLPESRVKNYLYQILKGVAHLHSHGVFHRDIKPENILIKGELIKVADLGSVRGIYSRKPYTEYISTRWYRSPECLLTSGYYGPKMDVWAIGCVFYELLTLKPLFPGSNELDQISKIHTVIGTPNAALLNRFKKHKSQNTEINFPQKTGTGFGPLLQNISEAGRDILRMMLIYDPKVRSATRRLLENRYFNDLRENDLLRRRLTISSSSSLVSANEWRNPVLLSFMTSERKRKQRHKSVTHSKVPRPVPHTPVLKQKIPESVAQPLKAVVGMHKITTQKPVLNKAENCSESKSKLIKREVQKVRPPFEKSLVLQETTNVLTAPPSSVTTNRNSSQEAPTSSLMRINSTSASFLPSLAKKNEEIKPLPRNSISQRHFISKSFLMSSNKPRLEPILEHITPRQYISRKLINNSQHFK